MAKKPWYQDGLAFECIGCGRCCTGEPGYVWVTEDEIERLAKCVRMAAAVFENTYVRVVGQRKSLMERPNGDCSLLDGVERRCTVYEARPAQCRTWPFWHSNLRSAAAWRATCRACPGSGQGPTHSLEQIETLVRMLRI